MAAKKLVVVHSSSDPRMDPKVLELQAANKILPDIFGVGISDVEEMILNRYEEVCYAKPDHEKTE